jgi:hypothetical protein
LHSDDELHHRTVDHLLDEEPVAESGHVRDGPAYRGLGVQPHLHTADLRLVREVG